jgi:putative ABC transport system permease protein
VVRNKRAYLAYLLSSAFAVMIFFIYATLMFHPDISNSVLGEVTQKGMQIAEYIIFVFAFLFVFFSVSAFLKTRKKEFGMLTILGSTPSQINRLILLENMIIGFAAILIGIVSGLIISKVFLIVGARVIGMKELPFYFPWEAMGLTILSFFTLFLFISFLTLLFVRNNRVWELLQGAKRPKKEPKASWYLTLFCILAFIGAIVLSIDYTLSKLPYIVLLLLVATYFSCYLFYVYTTECICDSMVKEKSTLFPSWDKYAFVF